MTYGPITFDPDKYGTYARASAAGDYIEMHLLNGGPVVQLAHVEDWIGDGGWEQLFETHFENVGTPRVSFDPLMAAGVVFDVLRQRVDVLGTGYPFEVSDHAIAAGRLDGESLAYRYLLGLSTAHAYNLSVPANPATTFELSIERALAARIGLATSFRRHLGGSFHDALIEAANAVELPAVAAGSAISVSVSANDEGLDVIAHARWGDARTGRWVFIGQATIAKSDRWDVKVGEPSLGQWKELIRERVPLNGFLAVPHHIQDDHWSHLLRRERVLLDRLRLAQSLGQPQGDELLFAALVDNTEVEPLL